MKKIIIGISIGVILTIVIGIIAVLIYKNSQNEPETTNEKILGFKDVTESEWKNKIAEYHNCSLQDVFSYYEEDVLIIMVDDGDEIIANYRFDSETGYAFDTISGNAIDFIKGKPVEMNITYGTNIKFNDNQILAVGYVPDMNLEEFVEKNFVNEYNFKTIKINDFRIEENRVEGYGNRFVFIPKTSDVKVEIYDCFINENGEIELDNALITHAVGSFILLDEYMPESTTPKLCIKLKYHGFEDIIPIVFSGKDNKLDFTGHEAEVKDISIY